MPEVRFAREKDDEAFLSLKGAYAFHSMQWLNSIPNVYTNCENVSVVSGKVYFPAIKRGTQIFCLPFAEVGNPLGDFNQADVERAFEFYKSRFGDVEVKITFSSFLHDSLKLQKILNGIGMQGKEAKDHIILQLQNPKELWENSLDKIARNDVRKAEKSGVVVEEVSTLAQLKEFYSIYLKNMRNFGTPQHSWEYFENVWRSLGNEKIKSFLCRKDGKVIAAIFCYLNADYSYVAYNVSDSDYRQFRPNDLLYWNAIKWSSENGYRYFDFGQADRNPKTERERSLAHYKLKWGGEFYQKFVYSTKPLGDGKSILKIARKLWRFLPLFVVEKLGPHLVSRIG